jgi:hypothetical protein
MMTFGSDGPSAIGPESHQADIATDTNDGQTDQKNGDLDETDHRTAVQAEDLGAGADQENDQAKQDQDQACTDAHAGSSFFRRTFGGRGILFRIIHFGRFTFK